VAPGHNEPKIAAPSDPQAATGGVSVVGAGGVSGIGVTTITGSGIVIPGEVVTGIAGAKVTGALTGSVLLPAPQAVKSRRESAGMRFFIVILIVMKL
jgi:hypothetical protein